LHRDIEVEWRKVTRHWKWNIEMKTKTWIVLGDVFLWDLKRQFMTFIISILNWEIFCIIKILGMGHSYVLCIYITFYYIQKCYFIHMVISYRMEHDVCKLDNLWHAQNVYKKFDCFTFKMMKYFYTIYWLMVFLKLNLWTNPFFNISNKGLLTWLHDLEIFKKS